MQYHKVIIMTITSNPRHLNYDRNIDSNEIHPSKESRPTITRISSSFNIYLLGFFKLSILYLSSANLLLSLRYSLKCVNKRVGAKSCQKCCTTDIITVARRNTFFFILLCIIFFFLFFTLWCNTLLWVIHSAAFTVLCSTTLYLVHPRIPVAQLWWFHVWMGALG